MVPDDTLNLLGYRGRISVYDDEENSNSAVGEDASVDEGNNNNNSNNNINNTVDNNNSNKISNNVDSGASSAVNEEKEGRVNAEEELNRTKKMLEGVRKELDDERRMREAADEPEMPREKLLHWVMVRKSNELRRGVAKYKKMNGFSGDKDLELKHRLKRAAGTILPCLKGDHSNCNQYSSVCADSKDPFLHLLPRNRNVSSIPDQISQTIAESIWSVFRSEKLDYLIRGGALRTTSCVEAVHRTIQNPAPKGKPLPKNQTAVLQFGATIAATKGRGLANVRHFQSLGLPMSAKFQTAMNRFDRRRHQTAQRRKTAKHKQQALALRRQKFEAHGIARESKEADMYRKEGFGNDHSYARQSRLVGELGWC